MDPLVDLLCRLGGGVVLPALVLTFLIRPRLGRFKPCAFFVAWTAVIVVLLAGVWLWGWEMPAKVVGPSKNACVANLKQIDGAKEQWALENKKTTGDITDTTAVNGYLKNSLAPDCPAAGTYYYNPVGVSPTCSFGDGHRLDAEPTPEHLRRAFQGHNTGFLASLWLLVGGPALGVGILRMLRAARRARSE